MSALHRTIHGWEAFVHGYNLARFKQHGARGMSVRDALFLARCCRWVAVQQHAPQRNPYVKLLARRTPCS